MENASKTRVMKIKKLSSSVSATCGTSKQPARLRERGTCGVSIYTERPWVDCCYQRVLEGQFLSWKEQSYNNPPSVKAEPLEHMHTQPTPEWKCWLRCFNTSERFSGLGAKTAKQTELEFVHWWATEKIMGNEIYQRNWNQSKCHLCLSTLDGTTCSSFLCF